MSKKIKKKGLLGSKVGKKVNKKSKMYKTLEKFSNVWKVQN